MKYAPILAAAFALAGCATPAARIDRIAATAGLQRIELQGTQFQHVAYLRNGNTDQPWHIYLEGDGTPFTSPTEPAPDPTPRRPLALELMLADTRPAMYLGRPCYNGHAQDPPCQTALWTSDRYSERVLASMAAALTHILESKHITQVFLVGHSGGGTLAVLLADRIPQTLAIITLSANLDTDAWTALHDYTPLTGSKNPARQMALPGDIPQWHLVGSKDALVPPWITRRGSAQQVSSHVIEFADADHACCWARYWPVALEQISVSVARPAAK